MANEWISRLRVRKPAETSPDPPSNASPEAIKPKKTGVRKVSTATRKVSKAVAKRVASLSPKKRAVSSARQKAVEESVPDVPSLPQKIVSNGDDLTTTGAVLEQLPDTSPPSRPAETVPPEVIPSETSGAMRTASTSNDKLPNVRPKSDRVFMHHIPVYNASSILEATPEPAQSREIKNTADVLPPGTPSKGEHTQEVAMSDASPKTPTHEDPPETTVPDDPAINALFEESPALAATGPHESLPNFSHMDDTFTQEFPREDMEVIDDSTPLSGGAASLIESVAQDPNAVDQISEVSGAQAEALQREWLIWPPYERAEEIPARHISQYKNHFLKLASNGNAPLSSLAGNPPRIYDSTSMKLGTVRIYGPHAYRPRMLAWRAMYRAKRTCPQSGKILLECITPGWEMDHAGGEAVWIDPNALRLPIDAPSGDAEALWGGHQRVDLGWCVYNKGDGTWGKRDGSGEDEDLPLLPDQWPYPNRPSSPPSGDLENERQTQRPLISPPLKMSPKEPTEEKPPTGVLVLPGINYIPKPSETEK